MTRTKEEVQTYQKNYRETHKEESTQYRIARRDESKVASREWYTQQISIDPFHNRRRNLRKFGLTLEEYNEIVDRQNSRCAICDRSGDDSRENWTWLHVDHDARLGKKKGRRLLLCSNCNTALGLFRENITSLENAIAYLEFFNAEFEKVKE